MKCTRDQNQNPTRTPVSQSLRVLELPYSASKEPTRRRRHLIRHTRLLVSHRPHLPQAHTTSGAAPMLPQLRLPSRLWALGQEEPAAGDEQQRGRAFGLLGARPACLHRRSSAPRALQSIQERGRRGLPWEGMVSRTSRCKNTKSKHHQLETCN